MRFILLIIFISIRTAGFAQEDAAEVLSLAEVLQIVQDNHPIISQANLQEGFAEAELRYARGFFDPKIDAGYHAKEFKGTEYYQMLGSSLKVPMWFPLDPKIEVYRNEGKYLPDENYVSPETNYWQVTTGVSLPLGQGLFIDERRALVKQARIYSEMAEAERVKLINKTLLTIIKSYWDWYFAYREYDLMVQSIDIAENLFQRVKTDYLYGEAAVVDTVQAKITYQSRKIDIQKASLDLTQSRLAFSIHLWGPGFVPLELEDDVIPTNEDRFGIIPQDSTIQYLTHWASEHHPEILKTIGKVGQLEVEQRWYREMLKPEVNLSYSLIDAPFSYNGIEAPQWQENYKFGIDFYFPLFLRKERAKLLKNQLYIQSTEFDLHQLKQQVVAEIKSTYAELLTAASLTSEYQSMAENYNRLLEAELLNLETGESDLFKLNIQQDKYIDAQLKYLEAQSKLEKLKATLPYTIGLPNLSYESMYE